MELWTVLDLVLVEGEVAERGGKNTGDRSEAGLGGSGGNRGGGDSSAVDIRGLTTEAGLGTLHGFCIGKRVRESLTFFNFV